MVKHKTIEYMESFWKNAIRDILAEERVPMRSKDINIPHKFHNLF